MAALEGLKRVTVVVNKNYQKSGTKSYVHLLNKWTFEPTMPGPYFQVKKSSQSHRPASYSRFGGVNPETINILEKKTCLTKGQTGEVTAQDQQNDSMYLCEVSIGTPPQKLLLDFDTGSSDLWCWSTRLPDEFKQSVGHTIFDPSKSSTFSDQAGSKWRICYGDSSSASGTVGTDNVIIGGLTIKNQAIELADSLSAQFAEGTGDGLLGLAFGAINTCTPSRVQTPVENMISQEDISADAELFTAYLGSWKDANNADKGASFYTFGYIDQAIIKAAGEEIWYTPVDSSRGFWSVASTSATVNGKTIARDCNTCIMDTGTTLALVDDATCQAIYDAIPGAKYDPDSQGYIFPTCTTADQLPVVTFDVGGKQFAVQKEDLGFAQATEGFVYGGIQSRGTMDFDILGDTFLKGIYAIFDQGNKRFGCVKKIDHTNNLGLDPRARN